MTFEEVLEHHKEKGMLSFEQLKELADMAHERNITVASHDDDTAEKLKVNQSLGVDISEFPITEDTAKAAHDMNFIQLQVLQIFCWAALILVICRRLTQLFMGVRTFSAPIIFLRRFCRVCL